MDFNISGRIRQLRTEKKISANRLSTLAGLSQSYIRKLELGETTPTVESMELICSALGISLADFFGHSNASLAQLEAIDTLKGLNDKQLNAFCELFKPYRGNSAKDAKE